MTDKIVRKVAEVIEKVMIAAAPELNPLVLASAAIQAYEIAKLPAMTGELRALGYEGWVLEEIIKATMITRAENE